MLCEWCKGKLRRKRGEIRKSVKSYADKISDKIHLQSGTFTRCGHKIIPTQKIRPKKQVTTDRDKATCANCLHPGHNPIYPGFRPGEKDEK